MTRTRIHASVRAIPRVALLLLVGFGVARALPGPEPTPAPKPGAPTRAAATPTPELTCQDLWPVALIHTVGVGPRQKNGKVSHWISGHIQDPARLAPTAQRIPVCPGTTVTATILDETGPGGSVAALSANVVCAHDTCEVEDISAPESYEATSADGKDTDTIYFVIAE